MDAKLQNDVYRGWCLVLLEEFRKLQREIAPLQKLRPPNFAVDPDLRRTLGNWDEKNRRLTLATRLLDEGSFQEVIEVLKHEVAHQLVSELFRSRGAPDHGEAFKRACGILKIPPRSRLDLAAGLTPDSRKLLGRVRKLMALGGSPNQHEAELALTKAQELALKHNLESLQGGAGRYALRLLGPLHRRVSSYIWSICGIVTDFYFTLYICHNYAAADGVTYRVIELYGLLENLDTAEYVYYFLLRQGEQEWQKYKVGKKLKNKRLKLSFLNGLYAGYRDKLAKQSQTLAAEKALVWRGDPKLEAFFRRRNPRVRNRNVFHQLQKDAHAAGLQAGRRLTMRPGLDKPARRRSRRLLE